MPIAYPWRCGKCGLLFPSRAAAARHSHGTHSSWNSATVEQLTRTRSRSPVDLERWCGSHTLTAEQADGWPTDREVPRRGERFEALPTPPDPSRVDILELMVRLERERRVRRMLGQPPLGATTQRLHRFF